MPKEHQIHVLLAFAKRTGKRNELGLIVAPLGIVYDMSYTCDMCRAVRNLYKHNLSEHIECTQQPVSAAIYQPHRSAVFAVLFSLLHHKIAVHHQTSNRNKQEGNGPIDLRRQGL